MRRPTQWQELPVPKVAKGEIRIQVEAAGLNRADLLQIKGWYPGSVEIPTLGLECSGIIDQVGAGVDGPAGTQGMRITSWWSDRRICRVLTISGRIGTQGLELSLAAGLCETWCTALLNLWDQAKLPKKVLIHAGASALVAAVQLVRLLGAALHHLWVTN